MSNGREASIRARLRNLADRGDQFELILTRYLLERFLYRLSVSDLAEQFRSVVRGSASTYPGCLFPGQWPRRRRAPGGLHQNRLHRQEQPVWLIGQPHEAEMRMDEKRSNQ